MAYDPQSDRYNTSAREDALARYAARTGRTGKSTDEDQARSILDGLDCWLALDSWRWMPGVRRLGQPRQRPM
jgi:hypothetical protein